MHRKKSARFMDALARVTFGAVIALAVGETTAYAEVKVARQGDELRLDANQAAVSEALEALGATYDARGDVKSALGEPISGRYSGSTRDIISRLLRRYDFVMKNKDGKLAITIYGLSQAASNVPGTLVPASSSNNPPPAASAPTGSQTARDKTRPLGAPYVRAQANNLDPMSSRRSDGASQPSDLSRSNSITENVPPPAPVAGQSVGGMLGTAADARMQNGTAGSSIAPAGSSPPTDMGTLTRNAASAVQNLAGALQTSAAQLGTQR